LFYTFIALLSTLFGVLTGGLEGIRALFYLSKEIEYFVLYFIIINYVKSIDDLKVILFAILFFGFINGLYALYQALSGHSTGVYWLGTIGEGSVFSSGGYFSEIFFVAFTAILLCRKTFTKVVYGSCMIICLIGLLGSLSRANVVGTISVSLCFIGSQLIAQKTNKTLFAILIAICSIVILCYIATKIDVNKILFLKDRLTSMGGISRSIFIRVKLDYIPYYYAISQNLISFLFGHGMSITGMGSLPVEAHNYYIRIITEIGLVGFIIFLYLIYSVIKYAFITYKKSNHVYGKIIGLGCILIACSLLVASTSQDAFTPVKVNEMFWIIVGLVISTYRLNNMEKDNVEHYSPSSE
jgi:hypothetical protein